jgi:two-component system sensor histidine kinase DegS
MAQESAQTEASPWQLLKAEFQTQIEDTKRELKEVSLMLEQSQVEVNKLAQRNASVNAHLQQVQAQFESLPRADIRMTYDSAIDAQQRMFVMRGQVEKLQSDQVHMNRQVALMERVLKVMDEGPGPEAGRNSLATIETVEMIIQAQEAERQRLSRLMHDGPAQAVSNFILQTEIAMRLFDIDQVKAREELGTIKTSATNTFKKVRDFIFELRPMMLDDLGLSPTLKRYVDAFKEQSGIDVQLTITGLERRLEPYQEVMVFRAIQELLNNTARHSLASIVKVHLDMGDANIKVQVEDNGKGFDVVSVPDKTAMGLKVIRERVEMLGGIMQLESVVGQGTFVSFQIPATTVSTHI